MPTLIDILIAYFIYFLPSLTLAFIFVVIGMTVYFFGKKENLRLMDDTFELFKQQSGDKATKFDLVEKSTMGRTYLIELQPESNLSNLRLHLTLVYRHLILSRIGAVLRKTKDYLLLEADPNDKIVKRYQLEILPRREDKRIKALTDMLGKLEKIDIGSRKFEEVLNIWVNDPEFFKTIFTRETQITKKLFAQRNQIVRVSFYPLSSPSIRLVTELNEGIRPKLLLEILSDLTAAIISLGTKGFYSKQKSVGIVKDKTIEKDERKIDERYKI